MKLTDPKVMTKFHAIMVVVWLLMIIPAILWWSQSVAFLVFISIWANLAAHWSAYAGSHAEKKQDAR